MLNWIAIYGGKYLFEQGGPLQGSQPSIPRSGEIFESAEIWQIWGRIQALHAGIFIALAALVVYHVLLNRTTLGYEVRAVGFNPDAAAYAGISVRRNYFLAMAISGAFAGLAGGVDLLGWRYDVDISDFDTSLLGFTGIAVALLGRNKAVGILLAASALRRAPGRDVVPPARSDRFRARAGGEPLDHDPGARHLLRRRRAPHRLPLAGAPVPRLRSAPRGEAGRGGRRVSADEARMDAVADVVRRAHGDAHDRLDRASSRPRRALGGAAALELRVGGRADRGRA